MRLAWSFMRQFAVIGPREREKDASISGDRPSAFFSKKKINNCPGPLKFNSFVTYI